MATQGLVLFMRHPQTVNNSLHGLSGAVEASLSELGEKQRLEAIDALIAWNPDRIFTSPLQRTRTIGRPVAEALGIKSIIDDRLIEIEFGAYEGVTLEEAAARGHEYPWAQVGDIHPAPCDDGESLEDVVERARQFVNDVVKYEGRTACVSHGALIRGVFAAVYDLPLDDVYRHKLDNVTSCLFESDGERLRLLAAGLSPQELKIHVAATSI